MTDKDKSQQVMAKEDLEKPSHIKINVGSATDDKASVSAMAMIAAIIIVYLILVITFRGGLAPFTILFSLPFTVIGSTCTHHYRRTISSSKFRCMLYFGIVVTNAIVLIDRVINNENKVCR